MSPRRVYYWSPDELGRLMVAEFEPEAAGEPTYRVAGLMRRAAACAIDGVIVAPFALAAGALVAVVAGQPLPRFGELGLAAAVDLALHGDAIGPAVLGMAALVIALFFFIFHALRGQTPGKRLLGLRVIDPYGLPPSLPRALARTAGGLVSTLGFSLGFLWIGFDREKRGLHDWLAGTWVVKSSPQSVNAVERAADPATADPHRKRV